MPLRPIPGGIDCPRSDEAELRSRNNNDFTSRYRAIATALSKLPDETVIDGEIVALDESGRPSFNILQNYGSSKAPILFYVFDVLVLAGTSVMDETLDARRALLETRVLPKLSEPIRYSPELKGRMADVVQSVKAQRLEGLVAKRRNSTTNPEAGRVRSARCGSTRDRSSSLDAIRSEARRSTPWFSGITTAKGCENGRMQVAEADIGRPVRIH